MLTVDEFSKLTIAVATLLTPVAVIANLFLTKRNNEASEARSQVSLAKIEEIHKATNGMKDALVNEVRAAATLAGNKQGRQDEKDSNPS